MNTATLVEKEQKEGAKIRDVSVKVYRSLHGLNPLPAEPKRERDVHLDFERNGFKEAFRAFRKAFK